MTCQICRGDDWVTLFTAHDYLSDEFFAIKRCRACGMASTSPQPEDLSRYYNTEYYGNKMLRFPPWMEALVRRFRGARAREVERMAERPGRVLDIGCGRGWTLAALQQNGWQCQGAELSPASAAFGREELGLQVTEEPLREDSFPPESFDVVMLWHSLEHLAEPREQLEWAARWLRPGGLLKVAVPNFGSAQARLGRELWFHLDPPRHLHHFGQDSLSALLGVTGFRPLLWTRFSLEYDLFSWVQTLLNRLGLPAGLLYRLLHVRARLGWREKLMAIPCLVAAALVSPLALALTALADGSTIEVWAIRT